MKVAMGLFVLLVSASVDAAWKAWSSEDPMTGEVRKGVVSSWTGPLRDMGFPYSDVKVNPPLPVRGRPEPARPGTGTVACPERVVTAARTAWRPAPARVTSS